MSALAWRDVARTLTEWREQDWIRPLDVAFARFVGALSTDAHAASDGQGDASFLSPDHGRHAAPDGTVTLLAAMLSHVEGRGHTCLALDELAASPADLLGWPAEAMHAWSMLAGAPSTANLAEWRSALHASPVVDAAASTDGHQPLVLHGHRLYLRRYWQQERAVASQVMARVARQLPVDEIAASQILSSLFDRADAPASHDPDWQRIACAIALRSGLSVITGGPGTGKTYTVARLLALLLRLAPEGQLPRITLAAPTGKAAARLRQSIEQALADMGTGLNLAQHIGAARTLHALLGVQQGTRRFKHHAAHPLEVDVLIVDEASMVHLEMMAALLDALPASTRLVLLGDKDQLASVEAGAVLGDLCRHAERGTYDDDTAAYVERLTGQRLPVTFMRDAAQEPLPAAKAEKTAARRKAGQAPDAAQGDLFAFASDEPAEKPPAVVSPAAASPSGGSPLALARQTVILRQSRRFGGPIGQLALAVNDGDTTRALSVLQAPIPADAGGRLPVSHRMPAEPSDVVALAVPPRVFSGHAPATHAARDTGGYRDYLLLLAARPPGDDIDTLEPWAIGVLDAFDRFRVLCAVREGPWGVTGLNQAIEEALSRQGLLRRGAEWYEGRPVMITRNDPALGVYNGDVGLVLRWPASTPGRPPVMRVFFKDGTQLRSVPAGRLADVETAFAMTVHKSQGSEFGHAVLALSDDARGTITRELVYTGITRARQAFSLVAARVDVFTAAIGRRTRRHSGLADALVEFSSEP